MVSENIKSKKRVLGVVFMQSKFQANPGIAWAVVARRIAFALPEVLPAQLVHVGRRPGGFTLVELLVVVTLLGIMALGVVLALDGVDEDSRVRLTRFEMSELHNGLLQFKRDVGHFPDALDNLHAQDLKPNLLFSCQDISATQPAYDAGCAEFDIDSARGWNGPYVLAEKSANANGLFDAWGSRYRLYDAELATPGTGLARIVSFGMDKRDGAAGVSNDTATDCNPIADSDDIVLCLVQ